MTTIYAHNIIESEFNSLQELIDLFYQHAYSGIVLGVKFGDKLATEPSDFKVSLHCSELYKVETL